MLAWLPEGTENILKWRNNFKVANSIQRIPLRYPDVLPE